MIGVVSGQPRAAIAPARRCAYAVLRRVFEQGAYADLALASEAAELDRRDRALAMRLAYGAVQRKGTLDHLIARLAERSPRRLDAAVLAALRLGLYELLYLSGAPDRAVVGDAVELAKSSPGRGHGLVNAVLRRAAREGAPALLGGLDDATPEQAAVKHSHPEWVARLWWQELGAEGASELMARDNEPSELALRANTLVTDAQRLAADLRAAGVSRTAIGRWPRPSCWRARLAWRSLRCGRRERFTHSRARRCSWRARSRRAAASACSTCARRRAARRRIWPR